MRSSLFFQLNVSQPSRSRASVADECFGMFKINLAALFWSIWILLINVVLDSVGDNVSCDYKISSFN